jgi:hypothetical protein
MFGSPRAPLANQISFLSDSPTLVGLQGLSSVSSLKTRHRLGARKLPSGRSSFSARIMPDRRSRPSATHDIAYHALAFYFRLLFAGGVALSKRENVGHHRKSVEWEEI